MYRRAGWVERGERKRRGRERFAVVPVLREGGYAVLCRCRVDISDKPTTTYPSHNGVLHRPRLVCIIYFNFHCPSAGSEVYSCMQVHVIDIRYALSLELRSASTYK